MCDAVVEYPSKELAELLEKLFLAEEESLAEDKKFLMADIDECIALNHDLKDSCLEALRRGYKITGEPLSSLHYRLDSLMKMTQQKMQRSMIRIERMQEIIRRKTEEYGIRLHFAGVSGY